MLIKPLTRKFIFILFFNNILLFNISFAQNEQLEKDILTKSKIESARQEISLTIQSVDISQFPNIKILVEASNKFGEPLDTLEPKNVFIYENGIQKEIISIEKVKTPEKIAVDFIFIVDKTGSMQQYIDGIKNNIVNFTQKLVKRGIDYRLGLILFSDEIEKVYQPTSNVYEFLGWISTVKAFGGGDEKENALEALYQSSKINYRKEATKVDVLITDAPYHSKGESGDGQTNLTLDDIISTLQKEQIRVFSIVPSKLVQYSTLSKKTRGTDYDIEYPFSTVLDNFSNQLTNIFIVTYNSSKTSIPDSIEIGIYNSKTNKIVRKTIPIVDLGRKLILEHLLFDVNSYRIPEDVKELNILSDFMASRPEIKILIEGHTDNVGTLEANQLLSEKRAEVVKQYLIKRGISPDRIQSIGYGELKPLASNATSFGRQLNRRTEIVILSK
ncbi:MAG TPA: OmpA family protein [Candidatus Kapabacteria bacterium]|jgi:Mg-chelatase subunit ChlD|nr:OmpA family protein [Candidatus Kapabacteria bacterium]HOV92909.1 OmpA family protein [Candidatus Kapabacteria bacterium]